MFYTNTNQRKGVAILISGQADSDFRLRKIIENTDECYIMIKGLILQVDKTILNVYVSNYREPN